MEKRDGLCHDAVAEASGILRGSDAGASEGAEALAAGIDNPVLLDLLSVAAA
ncbi:MAG: hypothetical protein M3245_01190 [Actinomycetota bacterium]|nr:hypothetical protein [Actinomycetota bacterium]